MRETRPVQRRIVVGVMGGLLAALLVLGTVDTLVWLPESLAPGSSIGRIYSGISLTDDLAFAVVPAVLWLVVWGIVTMASVLPAFLPRAFVPVADAVGPVRGAGIGGLILGLAACSHWWSAFPMGMSVADTQLGAGGGTSPVGAVIVAIGAVVGVAGLVLTIAAGALGRRSPPALS
jgi:hypothetical protein